jgi:divalent metal cation (Fe/Co/Zn/Cd) transporter
VARYRIRVGRQIGSAALVADGLHARTDGFTSLAVLLGAGGVAIGWRWADPLVGLVITVAILSVLRSAVTQVGARLMDAVDPALVDQATKKPSPPSKASRRSGSCASAGLGTGFGPKPTLRLTPPSPSPKHTN